MRRRGFLAGLASLGLLRSAGLTAAQNGAWSADQLPALRGPLTVYLGRGEGGLYEDVIRAIRERNPELDLKVRRGPSAALANTIVAEAQAGVRRADLFWAIDAGSLGRVTAEGIAQPVPTSLSEALKPEFRNRQWVAVSGRLRTIPYNPDRLSPQRIPDHIMDFPDREFSVGWAPAYGAFQSFITAMRVLEGEQPTRDWLRAMKPRATTYAGEFGVVMATARGEVDLGFANHYYTLRLKKGMPEAAVELALTRNDAGALVNASGVALLSDGDTARDFVRYLLSREVQSYLAREAYELPLVTGVAPPAGLPPAGELDPPALDLTALADLRPTLQLLRETGVL